MSIMLTVMKQRGKCYNHHNFFSFSFHSSKDHSLWVWCCTHSRQVFSSQLTAPENSLKYILGVCFLSNFKTDQNGSSQAHHLPTWHSYISLLNLKVPTLVLKGFVAISKQSAFDLSVRVPMVLTVLTQSQCPNFKVSPMNQGIVLMANIYNSKQKLYSSNKQWHKANIPVPKYQERIRPKQNQNPTVQTSNHTA